MWVQSLGWEAPLEEGMAIHSSILAWRIPWTEGLGGPQSIASHRVGHNWSNLAHKHAAFFMAQLSHPYMTTAKTIALTIWTFVGKVMSLLLNILPRLVLAFLQRSKSFFNFMAAVTICSDFGAQENEICHCFPIYLPWSDGTRCYDLSFLNVELN